MGWIWKAGTFPKTQNTFSIIHGEILHQQLEAVRNIFSWRVQVCCRYQAPLISSAYSIPHLEILTIMEKATVIVVKLKMSFPLKAYIL